MMVGVFNQSLGGFGSIVFPQTALIQTEIIVGHKEK